MKASSTRPNFETRLPQLSGRWVTAYRATWGLLALGSVALLTASLLYPIAHPAILALRVLKGVVLISVSAILFRRRGRDPVAALLSLAFLTWTITSSFDFASADLLPMLLDRIRFLLFALALLLFPDGSWRPGWTRSIAVASAGTVLLGLAEGLRGVPTRLFLPLAIACVAAAVIALLSRFRTAPSDAERLQLKWVALGLVGGIGLIICARAGAALSVVSPRLQSTPILWEAMFQLGIVVVALGFLVSLLRYRLFDAETAISRSAAFAMLTVAIVAVFAGTEATIENAGQMYLGMGLGNVSAGVAAAVAAVLLNPLHDRISDWAEQRFQRDLVLLKREVPLLLEDLVGSSSTRELGGAILSRICEAVHATSGVLLANGGVVAAEGIDRRTTHRQAGEWHRRLCGDPSDRSLSRLFPLRLPMRYSTGRIGAWLLLGPRPDGSVYGRDDLAAINEILPAFRRALTTAMAHEASRSEVRRVSRHLVRQINDLHARILALETESRADPLRLSRAG